MQNTDLWGKVIINLTKSPLQYLSFSFQLTQDASSSQIIKLKSRIHEYLETRMFDFRDNFLLVAENANVSNINDRRVTLNLKCKGYKSSSKKLMLRIEFINFLQKILSELKIGYKDKLF